MSFPTKDDVRLIPLTQLRESQANGRSKQGIEELAQSLAASGQLEPIIVRPVAAKSKTPGHYEIAAGHRRLAAARSLGWVQLSAIVREMDDATFAEVRAVDNLQRENLAPMDEARELSIVLKSGKTDVPAMAKRLGRTPQYLYDRLRLLRLIPDAQRLLSLSVLPVPIALALAKIPEKAQGEILGTKKRGYEDGDVFHHDVTLFRPDPKGGVKIGHDDEDDPSTLVAKTLRDVQQSIDKHVRFRPAEIPDLGIQLPETAVEVLKATSRIESGDKHTKIVAITHEHQLSPDARDEKERTYTPATWARADGKHGSKKCEHSVLGVIVAGVGRGEAFDVCVAKTKCLVHWGADIRARQKREKEKLTGKTASGKPVKKSEEDRWQEQQRQEREQRQRDEERKKAWTKAGSEISEAISGAVAKLSDARVTALSMERSISIGRPNQYSPIPKTPEQLLRAELADDLEPTGSWRPWESAKDVQKLLGVDCQAIVDRVNPKEPKPKKKEAKK